MNARTLGKLVSGATTSRFSAAKARPAQEDVHRFSLTADSSVDYRVDGPITNWRLMLFGADAAGEPQVAYSLDGIKFVPCQIERVQVAVGAGDYGYSRPLLLKGTIPRTNARHLRITVGDRRESAKATDSLQLSRVEIRYGKPAVATTEQSEHRQQGAALNPSILLFHKPYHTQGIKYVRRAAELGCRRVNVVVTLLCDINEKNEVLSYGMLRRGKFVRLNDALLTEFRSAVREVFAEVAAQGMDLSVLAHLNSGGKIYQWRNHFRFDPLVEYGGYTYQKTLIAAIADGLAATIKSDMAVDFALTGEMGHSVFLYPKSYMTLMHDLRGDARLVDVKLGFSFNFDNAAGEHQPSSAQRTEVQQLVEGCDFIGMSNYRWFDVPIEPSDFAGAVQAFLTEMSESGATIPPEMPLHFSEVGIGGGREKGLAKTPLEASKTPWNGSDQPRRNPWQSAEMQQFRRKFHAALLEFLVNPTPTNPVTEAFLWSEGSWDPMDIINEGFADPEIIEMIQNHNRTVAQ